MSAIKIALQHNQNRGKRKSSSAEVSPDSKCPICLDHFNNISYLDLCLHKFCFRCIHEWSKNKAECPLCKQPFNSIYHSIKSEQDFKKYDLKPTNNGSFGTFGGVRFRYRTTLTGVHRQIQRTTAPPENGVMFEASTNPLPQRQDRYIRRIMTKLAAQRRAASEGRTVNNLREQEMINFRKELYRQGVRVRNVRDGGRSRDTSAEFYRSNPACLHRLVPWLKRELTVLYGAHGSLVNIVQHIVMSRITRFDVEDGAMLEELRPFLQGCTEHFLHEFISFAKSPFNMEAYDQHAVYDCPGPSSTDGNSSNSSVIAISEDDAQSVELDPSGDSNSNLSHTLWDDETPGPSYSTQTEPSRIEQLSLPDSDSDSSLEEGSQDIQAPVETVSPHQKDLTPHQECFSSDSEDCVIVGFVKPTADRTPELVKLSSDSSDDSAAEDIKDRTHLPQHIRFMSVSPSVSQSSGPVEAGNSDKRENFARLDAKERHKTSSSTKQRTYTPEKRNRETDKDSHRSKNRDHRRRRRSQSGERRTPESYRRDKGHSSSNRDAHYSHYKRKDIHLSHRTFSHSSHTHSESFYYHDRGGYHNRYDSSYKMSGRRSRTLSRSRSRELRHHDRGRTRSRTYSSSRSPSLVKRKSHYEKPGGKRKYKTRHLEEPSDDPKRDSSKHRKKSKEKHSEKSKDKSSRCTDELNHSENSPERSKRHRKKKKKHKKKSKRHKSSERRGKPSQTVITIDSDSDNCLDKANSSNMHNSPTRNSPDPGEPSLLDT